MTGQAAYATLTYGSTTIMLSGAESTPSPDRLWIDDKGISGWWSTPTSKVGSTERQNGNGAHDVDPNNINYSARTVTMLWAAETPNRASTLVARNKILASAGKMATLRVVDANEDTFITGYTEVKADDDWSETYASGTLTIVSERSERFGSVLQQVQMFPASAGRGGLSFGASGAGLVFPLSFGFAGDVPQNTVTLTNAGTATAFPVLTVTGPFPDGVDIDCGDRSLVYAQPIGAVPLVLDSRTRTAMVGGQDASRPLVTRGFPVIPAGGSIGLSLQSAGGGFVTATTRDTFI